MASRNFLHRHFFVMVMLVSDRHVRDRLYLGRDSSLGRLITALERQTDTDAGSFARFARHHDRGRPRSSEFNAWRRAKLSRRVPREAPPVWLEGLTWQFGPQALVKNPKHSSAPCRVEQAPEKLTNLFDKDLLPTNCY